MRIARWIFGILYILAGIAKAFPELEDINEVLRVAVLANQDTILFEVSQWLSSNSIIVVSIVGISLFSSGVMYLLNKMLLIVAIAQILMMICFITILFLSKPQILIMDAPFIIMAIFIIKQKLKETKLKTN